METPLDAYKGKAMEFTIISGAAGIFIAVLGSLSQTSGPVMSSGPTAAIVLAEVCLAACGVSAMLWALANLAQAYKATK